LILGKIIGPIIGKIIGKIIPGVEGIIPGDPVVNIIPLNPVETESLLAQPLNFTLDDSFGFDWQNNEASFAKVSYPCMGGSTNALEDNSTNGFNLTNSGGVVFTAAGGPKASLPSYWDFPAASDDLRSLGFNGVGVNDGDGAISVAGWFRNPVIGAIRSLCQWGTPTDIDDIQIRISATDFIEVRMSGTTVVTSLSAISVATWFHLAIVYNGGNGDTTKIFINGIDVSGATNSKPDPTIGTTNNVRWGRNLLGAEDFEGDMTDMRIY